MAEYISNYVITSKNNPTVKDIKEYLTSSKERRKDKIFVLEGVRLCCDALKSNCRIISVFATEDCQRRYADDIDFLKANCVDFYTVSDEVIKSISDTVTPQGVVCTVAMKHNTFEYEKGKKYIALDTIQNPDNLGAISRTAEAFGIDGMVICGGCDIYNPKALRASMGALFRLPVRVCKNLNDEITLCKNVGIKSFATVPDRDAYDITKTDFSKGALCIIGNEGNGVSKEIIDVCDQKITIKMQGRAESLNAAAAASITMWELVK